MIYLILLIVIMFCSAVMDADALDAFDKMAKDNYERNKTKFNWVIWEWTQGQTWENKYDVKNIMIKYFPSFSFLGFTSVALYTWIAKDVIVIFLDLWHFAKAIMMGCVEYMVAVGSIAFVNAVLVSVNFPFTFTIGWLTFALFLVGGSLFNVFYYKLRKI